MPKLRVTSALLLGALLLLATSAPAVEVLAETPPGCN